MRIPLAPSRFIAATDSTASPPTSRVLDHASGASSVEENTTFDARSSSAIELASSLRSSSDPDAGAVAKPDIRRYVFAPIRSV